MIHCAMLLSCPNCGAIWGVEEIDFQECDCCGFPDIDDEDNDWDYDDDFDSKCEDNNPNDSRNL